MELISKVNWAILSEWLIFRIKLDNDNILVAKFVFDRSAGIKMVLRLCRSFMFYRPSILKSTKSSSGDLAKILEHVAFCVLH